MEHQLDNQARTSEALKRSESTQHGPLPDRAPLHPILQLQQNIGNRAVQCLVANRSIALQPKLTVGAANEYEREADRVAQDVVSMPAPFSLVPGNPCVQPHAPEEKEMTQTKRLLTTITPLVQPAPKQEHEIQTETRLERESSDPLGSFEPGTDFEARLRNGESGSPLPANMRAFMEPRFGADLSGVRLHTGGEAAQLNLSIGAEAFTNGKDIYLGEGKDDFESSAGKQLLAHELTHVVQQSTGPVNGIQIQRKPAPGPSNPSLEDSDKSWIKAFGLRKWLKSIISDWRGIQAQYEAATAETFHPTEALLTAILTASRSRINLGEEQIKTELNGDPDLLKEFHDAYYEMISAVVPKFASLTGKNLGEVVQAHIREIPDWALKMPELRASLVPGLGPEGTREVEDAIKARKYQDAIDRLVGFKSEIKADLLAGRKMIFDPFLRSDDAVTSMPTWDYITNKAEPPQVKIGPTAFRSVSYLYSVIMHEYQHVLWQQTLPHQKISHKAHEQRYESPDEVEAGAWEILHAKETGLAGDPNSIAQIWEELNEVFQKLDPKAQKEERPLVLRAFQQANTLVKGSDNKLSPLGQ